MLTLVIGGYLGSQTSHWIGGGLTDATGMPLTGWSTTGGDLRPAHFLANAGVIGRGPVAGIASVPDLPGLLFGQWQPNKPSPK